MALIECIECKNKISSLARACPFCGCPAEYQTKAVASIQPVERRPRLKDRDKWEHVCELVLSRKGVFDAIREVKLLSGDPNVIPAKSIVDEIIATKELPVELILKTYPNQLSSNISENELQIGARLKYADFWLGVQQNIRNNKKQDAIDSILKSTKTYDYVAVSVANAISCSDELPVDLIIEKFPDHAAEPPKPTTKPCSACGRTISVKAESCPHCGVPTGVHVCPKCGSTDVVYIDAVSKVASMALFGAFSVNTVRNKYECTKCKMKF